MSYDVLYLDFHNPSKILNFLCLSDLVQGMEDLIELKRRKLDLEERKVHALERIATVLENQQINQHSPPLSISPVIKFHWNWRFMWAFLAHLSWMLKWVFIIEICFCCHHCYFNFSHFHVMNLQNHCTISAKPSIKHWER